MIDVEQFLAGQQRVYDGMVAKGKLLRESGCVPPKTAEDRDGYLVILQHPEEIVDRCSLLSERIAGVVPAIEYSGAAIHTTIAGVGMQWRGIGDQSLDLEIVSVLESALRSVAEGFSSLKVEYDGWRYTQDSTLAKGMAGKEFVLIADAVQRAFTDYRVAEIVVGKMSGPWGGHITVSRFLECTPADQLKDYFRIIEEEPSLPVSVPEAVCLGYVSVKQGNMNVDIVERFLLK